MRLNGAFKTVDLATFGITNTYLSGYVERVTLSLNGISNVYIIASTPDMQITGRYFINFVCGGYYYQSGLCCSAKREEEANLTWSRINDHCLCCGS